MTLTPTGTFNSRQTQIVVINSILVFLSITAVILRFLARKIQNVYPFLDDWLILIALFLALGVNTLLYHSLHTGVGMHQNELPSTTVQAYALNLFMMELFWNTTLPMIKLSILFFLKRIFPVQSMNRACNIIMVFLVCWYIAFQTVTVVQCIPIHHTWQKKTTEGKCITFVPFVTSLAATNLATDVVLLVLPMRQVWQLQMRLVKKIGLTCTFGIGLIICAISIVRLQSLASISEVDITWSDTYAHLWTPIESSLGVVVACMPNLMPLWTRLRGREDTRVGASRTYSKGSKGSSTLAGSYHYSISSAKHIGQTRKGSSDSDLLRESIKVAGIMRTTEIERHVELQPVTIHESSPTSYCTPSAWKDAPPPRSGIV